MKRAAKKTVAPENPFPSHMDIRMSGYEWQLMQDCIEKVMGTNGNIGEDKWIAYGKDWFLTDEDEFLLKGVFNRIDEKLLHIFGERSFEGAISNVPIKGSPAGWEIVMKDAVEKFVEPVGDIGDVYLRIPVTQVVSPRRRRRGWIGFSEMLD